MAILNLPLADVKSVVYNRTSQWQVTPEIVKFGTKATWSKPYALTLPALPAGVASCTVSRSSSINSVANAGVIGTATGSAQSITVYYGDVLTIAATAATDYATPTASISATTVVGNVTASITAGAAYQWKVAWTGSYYVTNGTSFSNSTGIVVADVSKAKFRFTAKNISCSDVLAWGIDGCGEEYSGYFAGPFTSGNEDRLSGSAAIGSNSNASWTVYVETGASGMSGNAGVSGRVTLSGITFTFTASNVSNTKLNFAYITKIEVYC